MAAKVNLENRKRQLLIESERCREAMDEQLRHVQSATAWVPKTLKIARAAYPLFLLAAPLLGYACVRKKPVAERPPARGSGILATALAGYKLFRRVKPIWDGLRLYRAKSRMGDENPNGSFH